MEEVTAFKSSVDGTLFETEGKCSAHENYHYLLEAFKQSATYGQIDLGNIMDVLEQNSHYVLKYLQHREGANEQ